jgi:hypothetical protein
MEIRRSWYGKFLITLLVDFPCSRKGWINGQLLMSNGGYA